MLHITDTITRGIILWCAVDVARYTGALYSVSYLKVSVVCNLPNGNFRTCIIIYTFWNNKNYNNNDIRSITNSSPIHETACTTSCYSHIDDSSCTMHLDIHYAIIPVLLQLMTWWWVFKDWNMQKILCEINLNRYAFLVGFTLWRMLVSVGMNLRVPWNAGYFLTSCKQVSFSRRTLHHGVSK